MVSTDFIKTPRLYVDTPMAAGSTITLDKAQSHYLANVMRRNTGDTLRVFNGRDGEWGGRISSLSKREVTIDLTEKLHEQPQEKQELHLIFAPIKKQRMDFMIEKAVELGATHLHPIVTNHTEVRKLNEERIFAQIVEACEQSERLDVPEMLPIQSLRKLLSSWDKSVPVAACLERGDYPMLGKTEQGVRAVLIGPEGGFDEDEVTLLKAYSFIVAVSLGTAIMRAETAALYSLSVIQNSF